MTLRKIRIALVATILALTATAAVSLHSPAQAGISLNGLDLQDRQAARATGRPSIARHRRRLREPVPRPVWRQYDAEDSWNHRCHAGDRGGHGHVGRSCHERGRRRRDRRLFLLLCQLPRQALIPLTL